MDEDSSLYDDIAQGLSAGYLTGRAARLFTRTLDAELGLLGLHNAYWPVLLALTRSDSHDCTQRDLARMVAVEQPTMANTLARMERDGWIVREPDPEDRRSARVRPSAKAHDLLPVVRERVHQVNARALGGLSLIEAVQMQRLLAQMIANLQAD